MEARKDRVGGQGGGPSDAQEKNVAGDSPADAAAAAPLKLPPYETIALVLQGGGALGSYQAGVFQGLDEAGIMPGWIAGISIGALNTAIIAGNPPETRVARLREFWELISQPALSPSVPLPFEQAWINGGNTARELYAAWQATSALTQGQRGFFIPRVPPPAVFGDGDPLHASFYDTTPLQETLERFCDFDRINSGGIRVSIGAVDVETGNFQYFDNTKHRLRVEHFVASGALPPGFPPIKIDGGFYWDGGLMSNTPLSQVLQTTPRRDTLAFQVDLWSALGPVPDNLIDVEGRTKDIQYSSRTRMVTDVLQRTQRFRHVLREVLSRVPEDVRQHDPWCALAAELSCSKRYNVIHLIYQSKEYEGHFKDFQFGLATMEEHWSAGLTDMRQTLTHPNWFAMPQNDSGFVTHDVHRENGSKA